MADLKFEIVEEIGVVSEGSKGWKTELNIIKWGDNNPKYDLRSWNPEHTKMGKGVTLTSEELKSLKKILNEIE